MVPLETVFFGLVILFGIIGALRGWAKELLVSFSVILARFIEMVLLKFMPIVNTSLQSLSQESPQTWFYVRLLIFGVMVSFGYATTALSEKMGKKARKEKLQDTLLGFFIGVINGFLIVGIVWGFLATLNYGIWGITPPTSQLALGLVNYLPGRWLQGPWLFISVALAFAFVLIVFV